MKKYISVYDSISNPTGLLRTVEEELALVGVFSKGKIGVDEQGNEIHRSNFKYNDPDFHVVVITDHVGLLEPEKNQHALVNTLHLAISKWSEYVVKKICKGYNCIVVDVQQQEMAGDNNDNFKLGRLEPSETKLGDNKIVGRNYHVILGLFNPAKYSQYNYLKYDVKLFDDNFRSLHVIKHRNGVANLAKALWFDGVGNSFFELPLPDKKQDIENFIKSKRNGKL